MIEELLKTNSIIAVAGNRSEAKSSLVLSEFKHLRAKYPSLNLYVMGIEPQLEPLMDKYNINVLRSKMDLLDLKIRDAVIYIDEFALMFSTDARNKEGDKLLRFFDRLAHNNVKLVISTAREGFYNKFICGRITAFLVKQIEYEALVNGTWIKERVKAITSLSDYRLECSKDTYFIVTNNDNVLTKRETFKYDIELDSKKENTDLFADKKADNKCESKKEFLNSYKIDM